MVVGSVAAGYHGMARSTQDIDIVVELEGHDLPRVVTILQAADFYVAEVAAKDAVKRGGSFNIVDNQTMWKVDLTVRRKRPFSEKEFERRVRGRALDAEAWLATPEDVILSKLEWSRKGNSERQIRDAAGVVAVQGTKLDVSYIDHWSGELGIADLWARVRP
jgi:hypothetical protein